MKRHAAVFALFALAQACAMRGAAERGTGWWRLRTERIELTTDAEHDVAITTASQLARIEAVFEVTLPECRAARPGPPTAVVVLGHAQDYDAIAHDGPVAVLIERPGLVTLPSVIVASSPDEVERPALVHALAHRFVVACHPDARPALQEGLASFFETMQFEGETVHLGAPPRDFHHGDPLARGSDVWASTTRELFECDAPRPSGGRAAHNLEPQPASLRARRADTMWAIVAHAMITTPQPAFLSYLDPPGGPDPEVDYPAGSSRGDDGVTDHDLAAWLARSSRGERTLQSSVPSAPIAEALDPGEADLAWASMLARRDTAATSAIREHLAFASAEPMCHASAELLRASLGLLAEGETASQIVAELVHTDATSLDTLHARAWLELERTHPTNESEIVLRALEARDDARGADRVLQAALALRLRHRGRALAAATQAVMVAPAEWDAHHERAHALARIERRRSMLMERDVTSLLRVHAAPDALLAPDLASDFVARHGGPYSTPIAPVATRIVTLLGSDEGAEASGGRPLARSGAVTTLDASAGTMLLTSRFLGRTESDALEQLGSECSGRLGSAPIVSFEIAPELLPIVIRVESLVDTVLAVVDDTGARCDDDSAGGHDPGLLIETVSGVVRVYSGAFHRVESNRPASLSIERAPQPFDARAVVQICDGSARPGPLRIGMRVVLDRFAPLADADPMRALDWVDPMEAFIGRTALITALAGVDGAGCPVVRVDADEGTWLWRVRDLRAP